MQIQGVIFDLDGTLGDTVYVSVEAIVQAVQQTTGKTYTHPEIIAHFGPTEVGIIKQLVPAEKWEESCQIFHAEYERIHREQDRGAYPGIQKIIDLLAERGIRQAIVTGKGAEPAEISLRYFQLDAPFELVETGSLHGSSKLVDINKVLATWQLPPENVLYIGDASADARIARQAGVLPISAAWADTADPVELLAEKPVALFETVLEFERWLKEHLLSS